MPTPSSWDVGANVVRVIPGRGLVNGVTTSAWTPGRPGLYVLWEGWSEVTWYPGDPAYHDIYRRCDGGAFPLLTTHWERLGRRRPV